MTIKWEKFEPGCKLPPERRYVLVGLSGDQSYPPSVVVGYLRYAAGDTDSPQFVTPGVNRVGEVTHWSDCLPPGFDGPEWTSAKEHGRPSRRWR